MPGYPCPICCAEDCFTGLDDFDRASVGSNWHQETGTWDIVGYPPDGLLHELAGGTTGTANAKIYYTQPVPVSSAGEMQVGVSVVDPYVDDLFYIYLGCTTYHGAGGVSVEFKYIAANTWKVTLSTGETKDQIFKPPEPHPTTHILTACLDSDGFFKAAVASSGDEFPWNDGDAVTTGRYAGLGHNNPTHGAYFNDFSLLSLRTATEECVTCFCHCGSFRNRNNLQKGLLLSIYNATNRALCMGGQSVPMNWEWNSGTQRWLSNVLRVNSTNSTRYSQFKWIFRCGSHNPADPFAHFSLEWDSGYKDCCHGNGSTGCETVFHPLADISTCSTTLNLAFGPFVLSKGELSCYACYDPMYPIGSTSFDLGEYYISITEST